MMRRGKCQKSVGETQKLRLAVWARPYRMNEVHTSTAERALLVQMTKTKQAATPVDQ